MRQTSLVPRPLHGEKLSSGEWVEPGRHGSPLAAEKHPKQALWDLHSRLGPCRLGESFLGGRHHTKPLGLFQRVTFATAQPGSLVAWALRLLPTPFLAATKKPLTDVEPSPSPR